MSSSKTYNPNQLNLLDTKIPKPNPVKCYCDGACRGNPGLGSWGFVITDPWIEGNGVIEGESTNNEAEYIALIKLLEELETLQIVNATIHSDSRLIVNTVRGTWKCKSPHLQPLCWNARELLNGRGIKWISREDNVIADGLAASALNEMPV